MPAAAPATVSAPLNAHALLIQISKYPGNALPEVSDAADLAEVLQDPRYCGYPAAQVYSLRDHQATRAAMLTELRRLVAAADEDATVLIYFSGHGGYRGAATYLIPVDTDPKDFPRTALAAEDFARELAPLRARKVLLIFDCCHAGGLEARGLGSLRPGLPDAARDALLQGRGWVLFASSDDDELSYVPPGGRNSLFTKHFLAGLRGGRPSDDGYLSVFGLFEYLQPRVSREAPTQHPIFKCAVRDNFAIARHRGGAIGTVERTEDGFLYHALLSYAKADAAFVRSTLLPRLRAAGLRVATTNNVAEPDVDRVVGLDRGLEQARRTLVVVTEAFLRRDTTDDGYADHLVLQRKHADIVGRRYGLLPVYRDDPDTLANRPGWLASLVGIRLGTGGDTDPEEEMDLLVRTLASPVSRR